MSGPIPMSDVLRKAYIDTDSVPEPGTLTDQISDDWAGVYLGDLKIAEPGVEITVDMDNQPLPDDFKMAVGDVNSQEMGTGARANGDKVRWELMPLGQISHLMRNIEKVETLQNHIGDSEMIQTLADFQAGHCSVNVLLEASVAYNWRKQGGPERCTLLASLENVIAVWKYGLKKYSEFNWATGMDWTICIGCISRHVKYHFEGDELDDESNEFHSAHVVCNAMMLAHYEVYWKEGDDRPTFAFPGVDT